MDNNLTIKARLESITFGTFTKYVNVPVNLIEHANYLNVCNEVENYILKESNYNKTIDEIFIICIKL